MLRPVAQLEDREHLVVTVQLEVADPTSAGQAGVPANRVGVGLQDLLAVLHDLRIVGEEARRVLVVVRIERGAPGAHHVRGRGAPGATAAGERERGEQDRGCLHGG